MARLNHSELKALSGALLELYAPGPYTDLPARMFTTLRRCLSFDFFDYHEVVNNFENKRVVAYPDCERSASPNAKLKCCFG
jgi:hypothetical protein